MSMRVSSVRHAQPGPRGVLPQHAIGQGRHRNSPKRSLPVGPITATAGAVVVGMGVVGLSLNLLSGGTEPAVSAGLAEVHSSAAHTVVMEVALPEQEAQILNVARSTCESLNLGALDGATIDEAAEEAIAAYQALQATVSQASRVAERAVVLEGVPDEVLESYLSHDIPMRKLVAAADSVTAAEAPEEEIPLLPMSDVLEVPKVTSPLDEDSVEQLRDGTQRLDQALQVLPVEDRIAVLGEEAVDPATLTDEEIDRVLASGEVHSFRVEKQRRFAASLPDMSQMENGRIDDSMLCPIPWVSPYYRVLCVSLEPLVSLNEEFRAHFGYDLPIQSAYRSYDDQVSAHQAAPMMTTLPGTSNHSWGLAVDFDIDNYRSYDDPHVQWLVENGPRFGWRNPTLEAFGTSSEEPWHFEFGTTYPHLEGGGFNGPTPEVEYVIRMPEGWETKTLLSSNQN